MYCELRAVILCSKRAHRRRAVSNLLVHRQRLYAPITVPRFGLGGYRSYGLQSYYVRNPEPDVGPRAQLLGTTVWHVKDTFKGGGAASAWQ